MPCLERFNLLLESLAIFYWKVVLLTVLCVSFKVKCLFKNYYVCLKNKKLLNYLSPFFFSPPLFRNNGEFGAKKYFADLWAASAIQLFVAIKGKVFWSILFLRKSQQRGIPQRLLDKCNHLSICTSLKWALSNEQKPF